jgi:hypothetical protein
MGSKSWWALAFALGFLPVASGCGETKHDDTGSGATGGTGGASTSSGGSAGKSSVTGADAVDALWQAFCSRLFRCPLANDDDIGIVLALGSELRCAEVITEIQNRDPRWIDLRAKVASGAIREQSDKIPACLAEAKSCDFANYRYNLTRSGPACRAVFEGSVPLGGACTRYEECAGDARCLFDQTCPGQCAARVAPGQPCEDISDCDASGGYVECRFEDASGTSKCMAVTIATPAREGEPCSAETFDVQTVVPCADGLWCDGDATSSAGAGTCRTRIAAGAACESNDDLCVEGHACFGQTCKPVTSAREGDPCDIAAGIYCDPFARLSCVSGKCQTPGDGAIGSACSSADIHELLDCRPGLFCAVSDSNTGTCAPLLKADAPCQASSDCESATCANGVCAAAYCGR